MSEGTGWVHATVLGAIAEVARTAPCGADPSGPLEDLGIDSLEFVSLVQLVEDRLGITLSDQDAAAVVSVEDLLALCAESVARADSPTPPL